MPPQYSKLGKKCTVQKNLIQLNNTKFTIKN